MLALSELPGELVAAGGEGHDPLAGFGDGLAGCQVEVGGFGAGDWLGLGGAERLDVLVWVAAAQLGVGGDSEAALSRRWLVPISGGRP